MPWRVCRAGEAGQLDRSHEQPAAAPLDREPEPVQDPQQQGGQLVHRVGAQAGQHERDVEGAEVVVDRPAAGGTPQHRHPVLGAGPQRHLAADVLVAADDDGRRVDPGPQDRPAGARPDQRLVQREQRRPVALEPVEQKVHRTSHAGRPRAPPTRPAPTPDTVTPASSLRGALGTYGENVRRPAGSAEGQGGVADHAGPVAGGVGRGAVGQQRRVAARSVGPGQQAAQRVGPAGRAGADAVGVERQHGVEGAAVPAAGLLVREVVGQVRAGDDQRVRPCGRVQQVGHVVRCGRGDHGQHGQPRIERPLQERQLHLEGVLGRVRPVRCVHPADGQRSLPRRGSTGTGPSGVDQPRRAAPRIRSAGRSGPARAGPRGPAPTAGQRVRHRGHRARVAVAGVRHDQGRRPPGRDGLRRGGRSSASTSAASRAGSAG